MKTWLLWLKERFWNILGCVLISSLLFLSCYVKPTPTPDTLKDFKDGIQNHLVWSIKAECFFVRPHTETTVYLIRVADCDRK